MAGPGQRATDPLGRSLRLDRGDLVLERIREPGPGGATGARTSLATVEGLPALAQALSLTLQTQLGSDLLNAGHGFDLAELGARAEGLSTQKEHIKLQLVRSIGSDRRVADVREIFFDDDARFFELNPGIDPDAHRRALRARRGYTATVELETRGGDQLTLTAGGIRV